MDVVQKQDGGSSDTSNTSSEFEKVEGMDNQQSTLENYADRLLSDVNTAVDEDLSNHELPQRPLEAASETLDDFLSGRTVPEMPSVPDDDDDGDMFDSHLKRDGSPVHRGFEEAMAQSMSRAYGDDISPSTHDDGPGLDGASLRAKATPPSPPSSPIGGGRTPIVTSSMADCKVMDVLLWRCPIKSGIVFACGLALLIALATLSVISVIGYVGLAVLGTAAALKVAKIAMDKTGKDPSNGKIEQVESMLTNSNLTIPAEKAHEQVDVLLEQANHGMDCFRKVVSMDNYVETSKVAGLLWALTYVGACMSGMCVAILCYIGAFTLPKVYELYKEPIDKYLEIARGHLKNVADQAQEKLPFLKDAIKKQQ